MNLIITEKSDKFYKEVMCLNGSVISTDSLILLFGLLLVAGVLATRVSTRFGLPALILFMGIGIVIGSDITGIIFFDNTGLAQMIGVAALIVILFEGDFKRNGPRFGASSPRPPRLPRLASCSRRLSSRLPFVSYLV